MTDFTAAIQAEIGITRHSDWVIVDQKMIDLFADATHDHQFIHVDPARAAQTPFGGTIAHGFLTLSLLAWLDGSITRPAMPPVKMGVNYGLDRVRFISPVRSGSRIRLASTLVDITEKAPGRFQQTLDVSIEIEGHAKPALVAVWLTQFTI